MQDVAYCSENMFDIKFMPSLIFILTLNLLSHNVEECEGI